MLAPSTSKSPVTVIAAGLPLRSEPHPRRDPRGREMVREPGISSGRVEGITRGLQRVNTTSAGRSFRKSSFFFIFFSAGGKGRESARKTEVGDQSDRCLPERSRRTVILASTARSPLQSSVAAASGRRNFALFCSGGLRPSNLIAPRSQVVLGNDSFGHLNDENVGHSRQPPW
jgi:hypothetical protein